MKRKQAESRLVYIFFYVEENGARQFFASHPLCPPCGLGGGADDESVRLLAREIMEIALSGEIVGRPIGSPILLPVRDLVEVDGVVLDCHSVLYKVAASEEDPWRLKILPEDHPKGREPLRTYIRKAVEAAELLIRGQEVVHATAA